MSQQTIDLMSSLSSAELETQLHPLIRQAGDIVASAGDGIESFLRFALTACGKNSQDLSARSVHLGLYEHKLSLHRRQKLRKLQDAGRASHQERRLLAKELGLGTLPFTLAELSSDEAMQKKIGVKVVWRNRISQQHPRLRSYRWLQEMDGAGGGETCSEQEHYYLVEPGESVVFVSGTQEASEPELVVIHEIGMKSKFSPGLYSWLRHVVDNTVSERRNVRVGALTQTE
ncbi:hypothetical protein HGRIS_014840 [Hohenbuehelia grisea]|uniref:Uncharacterized protein n=1 Tax=Hohenbuehelia grisea TaxID=104357 RepID=A0ABR3IR02_9AGAR